MDDDTQEKPQAQAPQQQAAETAEPKLGVGSADSALAVSPQGDESRHPALAQENAPAQTSSRPQAKDSAASPAPAAAALNKLDLSQLQGFSFGTKWESKPEEKRESRRADNYGGGRRDFGNNTRDRRGFGDKRETRSGDSAPAQRDRRGFRKPQGGSGGDLSAQRSDPQSADGGPTRRNQSGGRSAQDGASRRAFAQEGSRRGGAGGRFSQQNREAPPPPYESPYFAVSFYPEDTSFAALAKTIRSSYRTLELFEIARTVVAKNDRFIAQLTRKPTANPAASGESSPRQSIYIARPDGVPFDSEEAVINYVVSQHIGQFFETEQVQVDPPKGNFQVINRCGVTGELLGPPNYHRYNQIVQQHFAARIKHLSFEAFRAKIETLRDEAAVAEWLEKMKTVTRYTWRGTGKKKEEAIAPEVKETVSVVTEAEKPIEELGTASAASESPAAESEQPKDEVAVNAAEVSASVVESADVPLTSGTQENSVEDTSVPPATEAESADAGPTSPTQEKGLCETFDSLEEAKVYLLTHARDKVYRTSDTVRFHGNLLDKLPDGEIRRAIEGALERQRRFPLDTANGLRGRLRREHFTIFKKGSKGISYVCAVKRKFRTPGQTFADSISALIDFIEKHPMVLVSELPERFLGIKAAPPPPDPAESSSDSKEARTDETASSAEPTSQEPAAAAAATESAKDSVAEREALHRLQLDLRWLVTEGYVTEFIDGRLFAAPPVPEARKAAAENSDAPDPENFPDAPPASSMVEEPTASSEPS